MPETQNLSCAVAVAPSWSGADRLSHLRDCAIAQSASRFREACGQRVALVLPGGHGDDPSDTEIAWWQARFLELLASSTVAPPATPGEPWTLATESTNAESLAELRTLTGWSEPALAAQRDALDHVDGVEIKAATIDGRKLTLFVPETDKPEQGRLALMSPRHPGVRDWLTPDAAPIDGGAATGLIAGVVRPTGAFLRIDGLSRAIPLVVSDGVQDHFGPTAVLVSSRTPNVDGNLVDRLIESAPVWGGSPKRIRSRQSMRFRIPSVPISGPSGPRPVSAVPVPVVWCADCGPLPVPADALPVLQDSPARIGCPSCGADAARDEQALVFGPGGRLSWLATETAVEALLIAGPYGRDATLADRAMAKALRDLEPSRCATGEPYATNLATGAIAGEPPDDGTDDETLRFALLHAAAPATAFTWQTAELEHCTRFLDRLSKYAGGRLAPAPTLAPIDESVPRRHKLAAWCATAQRRITENMTELQTHRATRNTMILLERIEAFETRSAAMAPGDAGDAAAIASALALLVRLAEPLAPQAMATIWERAGGASPLSDVPWPS